MDPTDVIDVVCYRCSGCGKFSTDAGNMRRHVETKACSGATLSTLAGTLRIAAEPGGGGGGGGARYAKPGPKAVDVSAAMLDRIPAWDDGDDRRIDRVFGEATAISTLLATSLPDIPSVMFDLLWSRNAPREFQSIVVHRGGIVEAGSEVAFKGALTKRYIRAMALYMLVLCTAICDVCVPARLPGAVERARRVSNAISKDHGGGLTIHHALERTDTYMRARPGALKRIEEDMVTALYSTVQRLLPGP